MSQDLHLSLAGGGAKGLQYIGLLYALERADNFRRLASCSGASIGSLFAVVTALLRPIAPRKRIAFVRKLETDTFAGHLQRTVANGADLRPDDGGVPRADGSINRLEACIPHPAFPQDRDVGFALRLGLPKLILDEVMDDGLAGPAIRYCIGNRFIPGKKPQSRVDLPNQLFDVQKSELKRLFRRNIGFFSGLSLHKYISVLTERLALEASSVSALRRGPVLNFADLQQITGVDVLITSLNISTNKRHVFSAATTPYFSVALAVRMSASFPYFFRPIYLDARFCDSYDRITQRVKGSNPLPPEEMQGLWIDGGVSDNQPFSPIIATGVHRGFALHFGRKTYALHDPNDVLSTSGRYVANHFLWRFAEDDNSHSSSTSMSGYGAIDLSCSLGAMTQRHGTTAHRLDTFTFDVADEFKKIELYSIYLRDKRDRINEYIN